MTDLQLTIDGHAVPAPQTGRRMPRLSPAQSAIIRELVDHGRITSTRAGVIAHTHRRGGARLQGLDGDLGGGPLDAGRSLGGVLLLGGERRRRAAETPRRAWPRRAHRAPRRVAPHRRPIVTTPCHAKTLSQNVMQPMRPCTHPAVLVLYSDEVTIRARQHLTSTGLAHLSEKGWIGVCRACRDQLRDAA